jgi:hypothetical protein
VSASSLIERSARRITVLPFTGEGKLVRKATGYEQQKAEAALSRIGFAG